MEASGAIATLTALGGLLELVGLVLVVAEIKHDRRAASELFKEDLDGTLVRSETVENPEARDEPVPLSKFDLVRATTPMTWVQTEDIIGEEAAAVAEQGKERDEALRRFLHAQITGSLRTRAVGVTSIGLGIILTTTAGVWGALANRF